MTRTRESVEVEKLANMYDLITTCFWMYLDEHGTLLLPSLTTPILATAAAIPSADKRVKTYDERGNELEIWKTIAWKDVDNGKFPFAETTQIKSSKQSAHLEVEVDLQVDWWLASAVEAVSVILHEAETVLLGVERSPMAAGSRTAVLNDLR